MLSAQGVNSYGIKLRSNGREKQMDKAGRVDKYKSCFTLGRNLIAEKGNRVVYLRVINPAGEVVSAGGDMSNFTTKDGNSLQFSEKKQVYYENENIDMCIYVDAPEESAVGVYNIEIYCEGLLIGTDAFELEDGLF